MFCPNCGKLLDNNSTFCPYCGTVIGADASQHPPTQYTPPQYTPTQYPSSQYTPPQSLYTPPQSQYTPPQSQYTPPQYTPTAGSAYAPGNSDNFRGAGTPAPKPPRAKLSTLSKVLIGAGAVVAVAAVSVGLIVSGVFTSDKGKLEKAVAKSISAYTSAAKDANLPDVKDLIESQKFSQSGEIALEDIDLGWYGSFFDASVFEGVGVRFAENYDLAGEKLSVSATPFYGSADLLTAALVMDGSRVYINSPELTGTVYYGMDTMTLGSDLQKLGADDDMVGDLSFNIFQLAKDIQEITKMDSESQKAIEEAGLALFKAIEVNQAGTETIRVNSSSVKCTAYTVLIPKAAMKDFLKATKSVVSDSVDYKKDLTALFSSIGLPDDAMDEIEYALSEVDTKQAVKTLFNGLEDAVNTLGDVELQVYISSGYVMAVTYSDRIEGNKVKLELNLGGGANYADDLKLVLSVDDYAETEIVLTSHGDHSAKSGTFKDETVLEVTSYGYTTEISSEVKYAPKANQNNFSWLIDLGYAKIEMEGQLTAGTEYMELHLEELELRSGDQSFTVRVDYIIGAYQNIPSVNSPVMLSTLNQDKMLDIMEDIQDNAYDWAQDLADEIPELAKYLFGSSGTAYPYP